MWPFKSKTPKINFVPLHPSVAKYSPILPARDILPKWWKQININEDVKLIDNKPVSVGTIKKCPGVMDVLNYGWVMPAWCDILVHVDGKNEIQWQFSHSDFKGSFHQHNQFIDHLPVHAKNKYHWVFKLICPWAIFTSPGYSIMQLDPFYFFNENFDGAGGIQDTDFYHDANCFLLIKKNDSFLIEKGTPLCSIYPFKREEIKGVIESYDERKVKKIESDEHFFTNCKFSSFVAYKKEQYKRKKCPFH